MSTPNLIVNAVMAMIEVFSQFDVTPPVAVLLDKATYKLLKAGLEAAIQLNRSDIPSRFMNHPECLCYRGVTFMEDTK